MAQRARRAVHLAGGEQLVDLREVAVGAVEPELAPPAVVFELEVVLGAEVGVLEHLVLAVVEQDRALLEPARLDVGAEREILVVRVLAALERTAERDGEDAPLGVTELLCLEE